MLLFWFPPSLPKGVAEHRRRQQCRCAANLTDCLCSVETVKVEVITKASKPAALDHASFQ
jgi:hypothetical protein